MPRHHSTSPSPPPDAYPSPTATRTTRHRARSRSRFSDASAASHTSTRRALTRSSPRGPSSDRRHPDDTDTDRDSSPGRGRDDERRRRRARRSRDPSRDARSPSSSSREGAKDGRKRDKIPYGFLAGIGVSALLLHKYWPKGWLHGDEKYWDRMGREGREGVEGAVRDGRDRLRHKGEVLRDRVGPAYEGFKDGYEQERDGRWDGKRGYSRDRERAMSRKWDGYDDDGYREAARPRRSLEDDSRSRRRPGLTPEGRRYESSSYERPPPDRVHDHVYDVPPGQGRRNRYDDPDGHDDERRGYRPPDMYRR